MNYERYISNKILNAIIRPQGYNQCSLTCIVEVFNILNDNRDTQLTIEYLTQCLGKEWQHRMERGQIGNRDMEAVLQKLNIPFQFKHKITWTEIKDYIKSDIPIIWHRPGHYCLLAGYLEEPLLLSSGKRPLADYNETGRWLVIADHRVDKQTAHNKGMLFNITFEDALKEHNQYSGWFICHTNG